MILSMRHQEHKGKGQRSMLIIHRHVATSVTFLMVLCHFKPCLTAFTSRHCPSLLKSHGNRFHDVRFLQSTSDDWEGTPDYDNEETLLKLHFSINDLVDKGTAFQRLSKYCQSFPFAAVLPVQPLQYLPTDDGGVDVRFLRKKTKDKGSIDGGIRFFLSDDGHGIDLVAKRNSQGVSVSKMFSEKLVVLSFIKRVTGEEIEKTSPPPTDVVTLSSIFHLWM